MERSKYGQSIIGDISITGNVDASGYTGSGDQLFFSAIHLQEVSVDPDNPPEGMAVLWMSDGTGSGDDGDIMMKVTAGASTGTATIVDKSSL